VVDRPHSNEEGSSDEDPLKFEGVWFGQVRYAMHKRRSLTIANTGQVAATVYFVDRPVGPGQQSGIAPIWVTLRIEDGSGKLSTNVSKRTLEPGAALNVELELRILDVSLARLLNEGVQCLEDILVLRVENGRDHFIPLRGTWLESSLGHSISKLIRIPEGGIRKLQRQKPDSGKRVGSASSSLSDDLAVMWSAPRELFRLTEATEDLTVRAMAEWGMLYATESSLPPPWEKVAGWPFVEQVWTNATDDDDDDDNDDKERDDRLGDIAEALDTDSSFDACLPALTHLEKVEAMAAFLVKFVNGMEGGIITCELWEQLDAGLQKQEKEKAKVSVEEQRTWAQEIISSKPSHSISFILMTSMMERIVVEVMTAIQHDHPAVLLKQPSEAGMVSTGAKKTASKDSREAWRLVLGRGLAVVFAKAMVRVGRVPEKEKERTGLEERKIRFVELFLG
jgi:phosphatidylinositol-bisphosphatase